MDTTTVIQSFGIALAAGALVWGLGYYILLRRLYVVTRHYTRSELSDTGKAVSFTVLNRGHRAETEIKLELDPTRKYALLATSSNDVSLVKCDFQLTRLPPRANVEAILLVEGGDFDNEKIVRLTSKEAGGKKFKKLEDVPQAPGVSALILVFIFGLAGLAAFFTYTIVRSECSGTGTTSAADATNVERAEQDKEADALGAIGWANAGAFAGSPMAKAYSRGEFPVTFDVLGRIGDLVVVEATVRNKLDEWLTTTVTLAVPKAIDPLDCRERIIKNFVHDLVTLPHSSKSYRLIVYVPRGERLDEQMVRVSVSLESIKSSAYFITRLIDVSVAPTKAPNDFKSEFSKSTCSPR